MMKEICAQCLQMHNDPVNGKENVVFSCAYQDPRLDHVRFDNLRSRMSQNSEHEKITKLWIDHTLRNLKQFGSGLNMAEIELSAMSRQCLAARVEDRPTLVSEVMTWATHRNTRHCRVDGQFTTADARTKLKRLYPSIQT